MAKRNMISVSVKKLQDYIESFGVNYQKASEMIGASHDYIAMVVRNQKRGRAMMSGKYYDKFCEVFNAEPRDLKTNPRSSKKKSVAEDYEQLEFEWGDGPKEQVKDSEDVELLLKDVEIKLIEASSLLMNLARINIEIFEDLKKIGEDEDVPGTES